MRIAKHLESFIVPISSVRQDPDNARKHNEKNLAVIKQSLSQHGQQTPIVVDKDGVILKGNGTYQAAVALGAERIAVVRYDGPAGRLYAMDDNRAGELAEWDWEKLAGQLRELATAGEDLLAHGWEDWELGPLLQADWSPPVVANEVSGESFASGMSALGEGVVVVELSAEVYAQVPALLEGYGLSGEGTPSALVSALIERVVADAGV
jgi:ParB-like chromosome segregation protein Spo0J